MSRRKTSVPALPPRSLIGEPLGRTARRLALRPPLVFGGHAFTVLDDRVEWCLGCYRACPRWSLREGLWMHFLPRWCPAMFVALPSAVPS